MAKKEKPKDETRSGDDTTRVMSCSCNNKFQDQKYGPKMRLHNIGAKGQKRCTVCGAQK